MTLTSPNCPVAESLPLEAKQKVEEVEEVKDVELSSLSNHPGPWICLPMKPSWSLGCYR